MGLASKCCLGGYAGIYNTADINKINPFLLWIYNRLWLSNSPNLAMKRLPTVYRDGIWWCCSSTKAKTIKFLWTQLTVAGLVWFYFSSYSIVGLTMLQQHGYHHWTMLFNEQWVHCCFNSVVRHWWSKNGCSRLLKQLRGNTINRTSLFVIVIIVAQPCSRIVTVLNNILFTVGSTTLLTSCNRLCVSTRETSTANSWRRTAVCGFRKRGPWSL